jgi:hypothetical protein
MLHCSATKKRYLHGCLSTTSMTFRQLDLRNRVRGGLQHWFWLFHYQGCLYYTKWADFRAELVVV